MHAFGSNVRFGFITYSFVVELEAVVCTTIFVVIYILSLLTSFLLVRLVRFP
jgi:hypothetical protein